MIHYPTIMADPPWNEQGGGKIKRGAQRHYPLIKTREIPGVIHSCPLWQPAQDAHLYLWATTNFLAGGIWVIEQLGFRYVTNIVWVKDRAGLGQYFRGQHELCLFGVRGSGMAPRTERRDLPSVIRAPRSRHSQKPAEIYELIEQRSRGPYLEIFARTPRPGWDCWGNEIQPEKAHA